MPNAITKTALPGLAVALLTLALAGCQTPLAQGGAEPPYQMGGSGAHAEGDQQAAEPAAETRPDRENPDREYEYRGGRDPITGRAEKQM